MVADPAQASALAGTAIELRTIVGQITPEEFRWQEANYDRNSALGRELLFLIANDEWARATSETIDITRSDTVETTVKIDIGLDRITHEASGCRLSCCRPRGRGPSPGREPAPAGRPVRSGRRRAAASRRSRIRSSP